MQQNEKPTIIGVGIALGTDKTAFARSNACPLQIYDGGEWLPIDAIDDEIGIEIIGNIYDNPELLKEAKNGKVHN